MPLTNISIDRGSSTPLYLQISRSIRDLIQTGQLLEGFRLPPERRLAQSLGVNRSTVLAAYRELKGEGLLDAHVGRGTAVLPKPAPASGTGQVSSVAGLPWHQFARPSSIKAEDPLLRDLLELTERREAISLAIGLPGPDLLPLEALHQIERQLIDEIGSPVLQHSPTEGLTPFRETLARHMASRGIQCSVPEILVTSGAQQGLDLIARVFVEPGDLVVAEATSYLGALQVFHAARARMIGIPTDEQGMRTDLLESALQRQRPKLIYTLPTFQNPAGFVMSVERRRHLLELAYRYQVPVVEDDLYYDLRYGCDPAPPVRSLDQHGHTIYLSSFSKVLCPGLRVGWICAPPQVARRLALAKQAMDLHSSTLGQWMIDHFLRQGLFERHLRTIQAAYARRRDAMHQALTEAALPGVTFTRPDGGFYFWCRLPDDLVPARLLARAVEERVSFLPGAACFTEEASHNTLRLSFSSATPPQIREGIARLARAFRAAYRSGENGLRAAVGGTAPIV
jgi:DNA-binding transcriptional MocR family regulator